MLQADSIMVVPGIITGDSVQADSSAAVGPVRLEQQGLPEESFIYEGYFAKSPYFHPELGIDHFGNAGTPIPYTPAGDDMITGLLLGCFVLTMVAFSVARYALLRQLRSFFHVPRREAAVPDTLQEQRFQLFLVLQTILMSGLGLYIYQREWEGAVFMWNPPALVIGVYTAVSLVYVLFKDILYRMVNGVFFDRKNNEQWNKLWLFLFEVEGFLLFLLLVLQIYGYISLSTLLKGMLSVVILTKILAFYKCFVIFFKGIRVCLQIILYFCALELMPLLFWWGAQMTVSNYLQINF